MLDGCDAYVLVCFLIKQRLLDIEPLNFLEDVLGCVAILGKFEEYLEWKISIVVKAIIKVA